jgi:Phage integrase family
MRSIASARKAFGIGRQPQKSSHSPTSRLRSVRIQKEYAQQRHFRTGLPFNHPGKPATDTEQIEQLQMNPAPKPMLCPNLAQRPAEPALGNGRLQRLARRALIVLGTASTHALFGRIGTRAKMPFPVHPHMLRHGCGYALANAGHDTRSLQAYLGHKNIQHTVRYTELAPDRFRDFWR